MSKSIVSALALLLVGAIALPLFADDNKEKGKEEKKDPPAIQQQGDVKKEEGKKEEPKKEQKKPDGEQKKEEGKKPEGKKPEGKKPDEKKPSQLQNMVQQMLKGVDLSEEQNGQIEKICGKYEEKITQNQQKMQGIITPEQKKARNEAGEKAKQEGKKGAELKAALEAAVALTAEQKTQQDECEKTQKEIMVQVKQEVLQCLTPEQKTKLPGVQGQEKPKKEQKKPDGEQKKPEGEQKKPEGKEKKPEPKPEQKAEQKAEKAEK